MLSTLINIIAAPSQAFEQLRRTPSILLPILLALLFVSATTFAFFQLTEPDFLIDDLLSQSGTDMSNAERAEAKQGMHGMPTLLSGIANRATLLLSTHHLSLAELNPFTLANLIKVEGDNKALMSTMNHLDLTRLWSIGLMLIGYRLWTEKSWLHSAGVVLLPIGAIFSFLYAVS